MMFQIEDFKQDAESSENDDDVLELGGAQNSEVDSTMSNSSEADENARNTHSRQYRTTPNLQVPNSSSSVGDSETRNRIASDPLSAEPETLDEPGSFRARSMSAPAKLLAARKYGRELRRMSDEFDRSFGMLPRPKSAGTAHQMRKDSWWTSLFEYFRGHSRLPSQAEHD